MQVTVGSRLGPYEIVAPIGAGGMGEVYKARDTRLDRSVAVKILPSAFADNAQLKIRFEREAKTISQLTHPHICPLYEMATGRRAFDGKTKTSLIAAIVGGEPKPIRDLQPLTPAAFEHVVAKCLAKDPDQRWQSASDVASELEWIGGATSIEASAGHTARRDGRRMGMMALAVMALLLIGAAAASWQFFRRPAAEAPIAMSLT